MFRDKNRCVRHAATMESLEGRELLTSSLAGFWQGYRTEAGLKGEFATVNIKLTLHESVAKTSFDVAGADANFTGTEHRGITSDAEYFADLTSGGTFSSNVFYLRDTSITAQARLYFPSAEGREPGTTTEPGGTRP